MIKQSNDGNNCHTFPSKLTTHEIYANQVKSCFQPVIVCDKAGVESSNMLLLWI